MKNYCLLLLVFVCSVATAQRLPDSIVQKIDRIKTDTAQIRKLCNLSGDYSRLNSQLALALARTAYRQSLQLKYKEGELMSLAALTGVHKEIFDLDSADFYARRYLKKSRDYKNTDKEVGAGILMASILYNKGEYREAVAENKKFLKLANRINDQDGIGIIYNNLGIVYDEMQKYDSAILWFKKCLALRIRLKDDPVQIGNTYMNAGVSYVKMGDLEEGIDYHLKAIKQFKKEKSELNVASAYANIGVIYTFSEDWTHALENYEFALKIIEKTDNKRVIASTLMNIGTCHEHLNDPEKAFTFYDGALQLYQQVNDTLHAAQCYNNIGSIELIRKNYDKAFENFNTALKIKLRYNERRGLSLTYFNLASVEIELGRIDAAIKNLLLSLELAVETGTKDNMMNAYKALSECYALKKNFLPAYEYRLKFEAMSDSVIGIEKQKKILELEEKFKASEKEARILLLEKQKAKNELLIQQEQNKSTEAERDKLSSQRWLWIAGLSLVLIIASSFIIIIRNRSRSEKEKNKAVIREKEAGLNAVIDATEEERKRIARELHDGIGQQLSGLKMGWQQILEKKENADPAKIQSLTKILDDTATEVRSLSHQMMPKVLSDIGLPAAIEDMLKKSVGLTTVLYEFETNIEQRLPEKTEISLYRICQELISNVLRHAKAGKISIQLTKNNKSIVLLVEDNGKGFDPSAGKNGIGMLNIQNRAASLQGNVNFESAINGGTIVTVRIPLSGVV